MPQSRVAGCRFSLSVMSDEYVKIIINAIEKLGSRDIWKATDKLSTVYRGRRQDVLAALKDFFVHANDFRTHITMEACFSQGCPLDDEKDLPLSFFEEAAQERWHADAKPSFKALCKIALYPLGDTGYLEHIAKAVALAEEMSVFKKRSHYASELEGDIDSLFGYFEQLTAYAEEHIEHYALQITLSVNSPSKED